MYTQGSLTFSISKTFVLPAMDAVFRLQHSFVLSCLGGFFQYFFQFCWFIRFFYWSGLKYDHLKPQTSASVWSGWVFPVSNIFILFTDTWMKAVLLILPLMAFMKQNDWVLLKGRHWTPLSWHSRLNCVVYGITEDALICFVYASCNNRIKYVKCKSIPRLL